MHGVKPSALRPRVGASTGLMNLPTQTPTGLLKRGEAPPTPAKAPGASPSSLSPPGPAPQPLSEMPGGKPGLGLCFPPGPSGWHPLAHLSSQAQPAGSPHPSPLLTQKLRWERPGLGVSPPRCQPPTAVRPWAEQASLSTWRGGGKAWGGGMAGAGQTWGVRPTAGGAQHPPRGTARSLWALGTQASLSPLPWAAITGPPG